MIEVQRADFTFTKRFSNRWQAMATYTFGKFFKDELPVRPQWYIGTDGIIARRDVGFPLAADIGGEHVKLRRVLRRRRRSSRVTSVTGPC